jgi:phosphoenolpyruvate synthase/pyruvate phosphate dikinase
MESGQFVLRFDEVSEGDTHLVGGKGLRLAEILQTSCPGGSGGFAVLFD